MYAICAHAIIRVELERKEECNGRDGETYGETDLTNFL
jgi:hypothetical protein